MFSNNRVKKDFAWKIPQPPANSNAVPFKESFRRECSPSRLAGPSLKKLYFWWKIFRYKLRDCVFQNYFPGVFSERHKSEDCHEVVLNGLPWNQGSSQNIHARSIRTLLLKEADNRGWSLIASADVPAKFVSSANTQIPHTVNNIYFCKSDRNIQSDINLITR